MIVTAVATEVPYRQHLRPVWESLLPEERGTFIYRVNGVVHARSDVWLTAAYRDWRRIESRRGASVLMEHGCGLQWFAPHVLKQVRRADLIAAPNAFIGDRYAALGAHVEIIGTPKMDALLGIPAPRQGTVAVSFHWTSITRLGPGLLNTYRDAIAKLAADHPVIGHAHPRIYSRLLPFWKRLGIEPVEDFADVVRRADVYCCDHSSTLYEWAALGRPVVLLDNPPGRRAVPQASGLRYERFADIGPATGPAGLSASVSEALCAPDTYHAGRTEATDALYPYLGCSTARMIDVIHELEDT